jgi:hypothetical protein
MNVVAPAFHPTALITPEHQCFKKMHLSRRSICVSTCSQESSKTGTQVKRIGDKQGVTGTDNRSTSIVPKIALIVSRRSDEYSTNNKSPEHRKLKISGDILMHPSSTTSAPGQSKASAVLRVTAGNFLEQFDFFLFGFYATQIAAVFFPAGSEFASLMMTFAVFAAGFLMRPLGAIILGAYINDVGRRKGLIVTLSGQSHQEISIPSI